MLRVKTRITTIKENLNRFRWNNDEGFHAFRAWSTTFLRKSASKNHDAFFAWIFEELKPLLNLAMCVEDVFAGDVGFDVAGCAVFFAEQVDGVADLFAWWNVDGDEFGVAALFVG